MFTVTGIRHAWPEKAGFCLNRHAGHYNYSFVHFISAVEITLAGNAIQVPAHTCILYRPGTPQFFVSREPLIHDWFHFSDDSELDALLNRLNLQTDTLLYPRRTDFITGIVQEMEIEFFSSKTGREDLLDLKIRELFCRLSRTISGESEPSVDPTTAECLYRLRSDMFLTLSHPWTVSEMAARVGFSESRFYSVYRTVYGNSPMDDLIRARIDAAKNALLFTSDPVSVIAESLGYSNLTHFIRQFKGITGISPAKYRKNNR
ncbi:MAG: helix-turn-helix transcriptional regulator [Clostridia bacterium]|nr:helix-turn-helix transcriptional regulator [Clostridia bacterium]